MENDSGPTPGVWDGINDGGGTNFSPRIIDGSHTGRTVPTFMDPEGRYGTLTILRIQGVDKKPLPKAPYLIRKSIEKCAGKIEGGFPEEGEKTYALKVRRADQVKKLMAMKVLTDGTPIEIVDHPVHNITRCVVSCGRITEAPDAEIKEMLDDQYNFEVVDFRRIQRRGEGTTKINTPTIILNIKGTTCPEFVDFGYIRCRTRKYYPSPMQCFNCWAFGHSKARCRQSTPTCGTCSSGHPCPEGGPKCNEPVYCKRCNSADHSLASRSCPAYKMETAIQRLKVDQGVTYPEARRFFEAHNRPISYAQVTTGNPNASQTPAQGTTSDPGITQAISELTNKVDYLMKVIEEKDRQIASLQTRQLDQIQPVQPVQPNQVDILIQMQAMFNSMMSRMDNLEKAVMEKDQEIERQSKLLKLSGTLLNQLKNASTTTQASKHNYAAATVNAEGPSTVTSPPSTPTKERTPAELPYSIALTPHPTEQSNELYSPTINNKLDPASNLEEEHPREETQLGLSSEILSFSSNSDSSMNDTIVANPKNKQTTPTKKVELMVQRIDKAANQSNTPKHQRPSSPSTGSSKKQRSGNVKGNKQVTNRSNRSRSRSPLQI